MQNLLTLSVIFGFVISDHDHTAIGVVETVSDPGGAGFLQIPGYLAPS
ncbi:MAG: hypothetical protein AB2693_20165 [Candidatus Thiodiazotropha sp.]